MERLISTLLKKQNQILLQKIAKEYQLDEQKLLTMYHTPTFYEVDKIPSDYQVKIKQTGKKK